MDNYQDNFQARELVIHAVSSAAIGKDTTRDYRAELSVGINLIIFDRLDTGIYWEIQFGNGAGNNGTRMKVFVGKLFRGFRLQSSRVLTLKLFVAGQLLAIIPLRDLQEFCKFAVTVDMRWFWKNQIIVSEEFFVFDLFAVGVALKRPDIFFKLAYSRSPTYLLNRSVFVRGLFDLSDLFWCCPKTCLNFVEFHSGLSLEGCCPKKGSIYTQQNSHSHLH